MRSLDLLLAEVAAAPLVADLGDLRPLPLARRTALPHGNAAHGAWPKAGLPPVLGAWLRGRARALGLPDALDDAIRHLWEGAVDLLGPLSALARRILRPDGDAMALRPVIANDGTDPFRASVGPADPSGAHAILRWRWCSLVLPPWFWTSAACPGPRVPLRVRLLPLHVVPASPAALHHAHAGATLSFWDLWTALRRNAPPAGRAPGDEAGELLRWVRRAHVVRLDLAGVRTSGTGHYRDLVRIARRDLMRGRLPRWQPTVESRLAKLAARFDSLPEETLERRILRAALDRNASVCDEERLLAVQVLRVEARLFRWVTYDPSTPGLPAFSRAYRGMRSIVGRLRSQAHTPALVSKIVARNLPLRIDAVELRTSVGRAGRVPLARKLERMVGTKRDPRANRSGRYAHDRGAIRSHENVERGILIHMLRSRGDPSDDGEEIRNRRDTVRGYAATARAVCHAIDADPRILHILRGFDLAGVERHGPLALAARYLSDMRRAAETFGRYACLDRCRPCGLTVHAGEDFRHILAGLRAVVEPIAWGVLRSGDRIGHATALRIDVDRWIRTHGDAVCPRIERAFDLAWALEWAPKQGIALGDAVRARWEHELRIHTTAVFDEAISACELSEIGAALARIRFHGVGPTLPSSTASKRRSATRRALELVLDRATVRRSLRRIRVFTPLDDVEPIERLQDAACRFVASCGLLVEINPSSNLLIGDLEDPRMHPSLRAWVERKPRIPFSMSPDDPILFGTNTADEFAYFWSALLLSGIGPAEASRALEDAARDSMSFRFTLRRNGTHTDTRDAGR